MIAGGHDGVEGGDPPGDERPPACSHTHKNGSDQSIKNNTVRRAGVRGDRLNSFVLAMECKVFRQARRRQAITYKSMSNF
jgi:hypothetical protein